MNESWSLVLVALISMITHIVTAWISNRKNRERTDVVKTEVAAVKHIVNSKNDLLNIKNDRLLDEVTELRRRIEELRRQRNEGPDGPSG